MRPSWREKNRFFRSPRCEVKRGEFREKERRVRRRKKRLHERDSFPFASADRPVPESRPLESGRLRRSGRGALGFGLDCGSWPPSKSSNDGDHALASGNEIRTRPVYAARSSRIDDARPSPRYESPRARPSRPGEPKRRTTSRREGHSRHLGAGSPQRRLRWCSRGSRPRRRSCSPASRQQRAFARPGCSRDSQSRVFRRFRATRASRPRPSRFCRRGSFPCRGG